MIKGITIRGTGYRARVSINGHNKSKYFTLKVFRTRELAYENAVEWLLATQKELAVFATGKTSKYREIQEVVLTQELLKEYLEYNPITGIFIWKKAFANCVVIGSNAGCFDDNKYIIIGLFNKVYKAHRLAFLYMLGEMPVETVDIDHIDGIEYNNAWDNLRIATRQQNVFNSNTKLGISGVKGVSFIKPNKWRGNVEAGGTKLEKLFDTVEDAAKWVQITREQLHGEFANHG